MQGSITLEGVRIYVDLIKLTKNINHTARRTLKGFISKDDKSLANDLLESLKDHITSSSQLFPIFDDEDGEIDFKLPSFYNFSLDLFHKSKNDLLFG